MAVKPKRRCFGLKISIKEDDGLHRLMVESRAGVNPAGWRLQRGEFFPIAEFEFFDEGEAKMAQAKLQEYLNRC